MKQYQIAFLSSMNTFWRVCMMDYSVFVTCSSTSIPKTTKYFKNWICFYPHMKGQRGTFWEGLKGLSYMPEHKISLHVWCPPSQYPILIKIPAQNVLNFCMIKRWPPIFRPWIRKIWFSYIRVNMVAVLIHWKTCQYIFPIYVPKNRFHQQMTYMGITCDCH